MSYLKRNINTLLFIVVILLIGFTITLSSFYQANYEEVSSGYYSQVAEYQDVIAELQAREQSLNQTSSELSRKTQDTEKLGQLYTQVETENVELEDQISTLSEQLQIAKTQLTVAQTALSEEKAKSAGIQSDIDKYILQTENLEEAIQDARSNLKSDHGLTDENVDSALAEIIDTLDELEDIE